MKKINLALTTLAVTTLPVATIISCSTNKKEATPTKPATPSIEGNKGATVQPGAKPKTPAQQLGTTPVATGSKPKVATQQPATSTITQTHQQTNVNHQTQTSQVSNVSTDLTSFKISNSTEDPMVYNFLPDVNSTPRTFRVYDNGIFKIKIENKLIGNGKFYASEAKADMQAKDIARQINVGPAAFHLEKGIQILYSNNPASLGGPAGVQIAVNNSLGSTDDVGIKNETSLVAHEYGHHETMWDFQHIIGGTPEDTSSSGRETLRHAMVEGLKAAGYAKISQLASQSNDAKQAFGFMQASDSDFPTDYGVIKAGRHSIFQNMDYPFSAAEIATRMLNILSFRTDLDPLNIYHPGKAGMYIANPGAPVYHVFEPPAAFVSDATIRHFASDSVFNEGKDNSRINNLIDFYMKKIFGLGTGSVSLIGEANTGVVKGLKFDSFGTANNLDKIEVVNQQGKVIASSKVKTFDSQFGFKSELISNKWTKEFHQSVKSISDLQIDIKNASFSTYKIYGRDASGNEVDLSSIKVAHMGTGRGDQVYSSFFGLEHEGKHLHINFSK